MCAVKSWGSREQAVATSSPSAMQARRSAARRASSDVGRDDLLPADIECLLCGNREVPVIVMAQGEDPAVGHFWGNVLEELTQGRRGHVPGRGVKNVNPLAPLSQRIEGARVLGREVHAELDMAEMLGEMLPDGALKLLRVLKTDRLLVLRNGEEVDVGHLPLH